jgi:hypothetical protein
MKERKSWKEFQQSGLLWWVNRGLHVFGWSIVFDEDDAGNVVDVYPARVAWRGFQVADEVEGFQRLTHYMEANAAELRKEVDE